MIKSVNRKLKLDGQLSKTKSDMQSTRKSDIFTQNPYMENERSIWLPGDHWEFESQNKNADNKIHAGGQDIHATSNKN